MDFYVLLGVHREASDEEIRKAYRRLARRFHPNLNPGDRQAAARFAEILSAYETLIDPARRQRYDAGGPATLPRERASFGFDGFDFSAGASGGSTTTFGELFEEVLAGRAPSDGAAVDTRGADLHARASLTFEEAWRGVAWPVTITRRQPCRACEGRGGRPAPDAPCPRCGGAGLVRTARGRLVFSKACAPCGGTGRLQHAPCGPCQGLGVEHRTESLTIRIPAGVADRARVRVPGKGHAGLRGGAPGDLYVDVEVAPDPRFERHGDDLHLELPIAIHEAALGARIDIATPDGPARVRIPPGTQSGQRFRLRERGAPSVRGGPRGDLVVRVTLRLPNVLDERSKTLLKEFGRINGESVRDEG